MEILLATKNNAKIEIINWLLEDTKFQLIQIPDDKKKDISEDGACAKDNARIKALAYSQDFEEPVLALDNALWFKGLKDEEQPKERVKKFGKKMDTSQNEDEIMRYYSYLIGIHGTMITGYWEYAFCLARKNSVLGEINFNAHTMLFSNIPCNKRIPGFPLAVFQIDPYTRQYTALMSKQEQKEYRKRTLGNTLAVFLKEILL